MVIERQQERMRVKCATRLSLCKKIWSRTIVISRSWFREKVVFYQCYSPQGGWDKMAEKMMLTFAESAHPVFRATGPLSRGQLKAKAKENCRFTIVQTWKRLKLFFAQLLLFICSVFAEQSQYV